MANRLRFEQADAADAGRREAVAGAQRNAGQHASNVIAVLLERAHLTTTFQEQRGYLADAAGWSTTSHCYHTSLSAW
mgnify:CR=1 FL=1|jgi:ABC-type phosphate/phosphonate transport system substrate-binding protein|tara:strand:+ start:15637 stop:15867 length:231 start_codon:yes stop_codon:yes gene_type:complete